MNKRILSLTLALVMILGTFTAVFAAEQTAQEKAGAFLEEVGLLKGDEKGDLLLNENLERRDSVVLLARLLGEEDSAAKTKVDEKTPSWTDVRTDDYYVPFFAWAQISKNFEGKENNKFEPRADLTTQEYATVLLRALGHELNGKDAWKTVMELAEKNGLLENVDSKANEALKRGDMAVMTLNALSATVKGTGNTLADELNIKLPVPAKLEVEDVYADNLKEVKIKLNKSIAKEVAENVNNYKLENIEISKAELKNDVIVLLLDVDNDNTVLKNNKEYKLVIDKLVDGKVTIKDSFKFKPMDNEIPEVVEVIGLGTKAAKVVMSEPIKQTNIRSFKLDGKSINGTAKVVGREIFIRTYRDMEIGEHDLYVGQVVDFNGFKHEASEYSFVIEEDNDAPVVVSHNAETTKLTVEFDEDVDQTTVNEKSAYWMFGKTKKYSNGKPKSLAGNKYEFYFSENEIPLKDTTLILDGIKDYSGNAMKEYEIIVSAELDRTAPEVTSAKVSEDRNDIIIVKYNKDVKMGDHKNSAENLKNYELKDDKGNKIALDSVVNNNSEKEVKLITKDDLKSSRSYQLTVSDVSDLNRYPNYLYGQTVDVDFRRESSPQANKTTIKDNGNGYISMTVFFTKDMDLATTADPNNYLIKYGNKVEELIELDPYMTNRNDKEVVIELSVENLKSIFGEEIELNKFVSTVENEGLFLIGRDLKDKEGNRISNSGIVIDRDSGSAITVTSGAIEVTDNKLVVIPFSSEISKIDTKKDITFTGAEVTVKSVEKNGKNLEVKVDGLPKSFADDAVKVSIPAKMVYGQNGIGNEVIADKVVKDKIAPTLDKVIADASEGNKTITFEFSEDLKSVFADSDVKVSFKLSDGSKIQNVKLTDIDFVGEGEAIKNNLVKAKFDSADGEEALNGTGYFEITILNRGSIKDKQGNIIKIDNDKNYTSNKVTIVTE